MSKITWNRCFIFSYKRTCASVCTHTTGRGGAASVFHQCVNYFLFSLTNVPLERREELWMSHVIFLYTTGVFQITYSFTTIKTIMKIYTMTTKATCLRVYMLLCGLRDHNASCFISWSCWFRKSKSAKHRVTNAVHDMEWIWKIYCA